MSFKQPSKPGHLDHLLKRCPERGYLGHVPKTYPFPTPKSHLQPRPILATNCHHRHQPRVLASVATIATNSPPQLPT